MGTASKVCSVILRVGELVSAAIVAGLLGEYLHYVSDAHDSAGSRIIYTVALAGISLVVCLVCMAPVDILFYGFLLDGALFVMWMTAFGLLVNLSGNGGCNSTWYWTRWGWFWGGWYAVPVPNQVNQSLVGTSSCGSWRATIAWSFIGGWCWFLSACLGTYVVFRIREKRRDAALHHSNMEEANKVISDHGTAGTHDTSGVPVATTA